MGPNGLRHGYANFSFFPWNILKRQNVNLILSEFLIGFWNFSGHFDEGETIRPNGIVWSVRKSSNIQITQSTNQFAQRYFFDRGRCMFFARLLSLHPAHFGFPFRLFTAAQTNTRKISADATKNMQAAQKDTQCIPKSLRKSGAYDTAWATVKTGLSSSRGRNRSLSSIERGSWITYGIWCGPVKSGKQVVYELTSMKNSQAHWWYFFSCRKVQTKTTGRPLASHSLQYVSQQVETHGTFRARPTSALSHYSFRVCCQSGYASS